MVPPFERFRLAVTEPATIELETAAPDTTEQLPVARRRVSTRGRVSFASTYYLAGVWLAGETVDIVCDGRLVYIHHRGVLIATHARRHKPANEAAAVRRGEQRAPLRLSTPRPTASSASVTRKVDSSGNLRFDGTNYRIGNQFRRRQVEVVVVGETIEISIGEQLIRTHTVRHDRTREHRALANPGGRPRRTNAV